MNNNILAEQMRNNYENNYNISLTKKMPVIIKLDGYNFKSFTKKLIKPFDYVASAAMQDTLKYLCGAVKNCVFGYTYSDKIILVLIDYTTNKTSAWFNYDLKSLCSLSASMATFAFNKSFLKQVNILSSFADRSSIEFNYINEYQKASSTGLIFNAEVFNIPKEAVNNYLVVQSNKALEDYSNQIENLNTADDHLSTIPDYISSGVYCIKNKTWELKINDINFKEYPAFINDLVDVGEQLW